MTASDDGSKPPLPAVTDFEALIEASPLARRELRPCGKEGAA